jgi:hypothetical protein
MPKHSVCAEIGVHEGDFSVEILRRVKPAALQLIDPWRHEGGQEYQTAWYSVGQSTMDSRYESVLRRFDKEIKRKRVQVHRAYSSVAVTSFPDDYFDWVYIDGNHLDEFVRKDLELYYPKVKSGGYLTGEDYGVEGWWKNGVQTAVDDFVRTRGLKFELIETQFVFRKPRND